VATNKKGEPVLRAEVAPQAFRLLTTAEVAETMRITPTYVRELVARGTLEPIRLSPRGRLLFRVADVERVIAGEVRNP